MATSGDYNDLTNKPNLAPVATSGDYNDLTNKPTIPEVPTNISAFVNDAGYITAIPDSFGGISLETDPIFSAWNKDYNDLINRPNLAPVATSGDYNDLSSKPVNADFGHGIVRTNVNNPSGATDINVTFTGYQLMNGGVVSLAFTRNVPAGATLNINGQGAKPIRWKGVALTDGVIKAGDRCLFMYNSGNNSYYLLANDRWGVDIDALATVAHTGSYNDLTDKPELFSGDYNDLTNKPTIPTEVSAFINDAGYITQDQIPAQVNADWNATNGPAEILNKPTIPTVPTNISAFVNDMGYITAIPDSLGGISLESDPIFTAWNKDYNDLTNRPELFSGDYNDLSNKPTNADFGHGIVRTNVNNAAGATDINVTFTGYQLMNGGVVSLAFTRNVPAGATLNINGQGAKAIRWKGIALTDGVIKAGDRCLFMYNSGNNSYYLLANDRWGSDIDALATVAFTGNYNDLTNTPELFSGDYNDLTNTPELFSGNYNDLTDKPTIPTIPENVSAFNNDAGYITEYTETDPLFTAWNKDYNDLTNKPVNADFGQGLVRTNVNNAAGATDIAVAFTGYQLVTGGMVSLGFKRNVPAGATLNINNQGAKAIFYKGAALTDGVIKANDRCLFMYNSGANAYYLLAIDRWGADLEALAAVARTGSYNDLTDKPNLAPVATSGNYNDLTNTPTIPTVPTNVSDFNNDAGYITSDDIPAQVNADWNATEGVAQILNKPDLAPVATSGNYNDLTDKPTIPTVPTNISAFVNDMGYLTSIPDSFGGVSVEYDPVFSAWNRDYYSLTNLPELFSGNYNDLTNKPTLFSGNYNDLTNKPTNADFGHGLVRTNVNNAAGATDINVTFTGYQLMNGGVVSLAFTRNVPAGATLNINGQGAKAIRWKGTALTDGIIKAGDRCLFMYNSGNNSYYLLADDRWGDDLEALATVAHTGSYNDLVDKPDFATVATTGSYNDLIDKPDLFSGNYNDLTDKPDLFSGDYNDLTNKPTNATFGQGIVRTKVSNAVGATDIAVTFTGYALENGGVVSLAFVNNVPAGATLNINAKGAKPIYYKEAALTDGIIKAGDRCVFMYNSGNGRYYLLANDRWGTDIDDLATVAHTGNYNDLDGRPSIPAHISDLDNDRGYITLSDIPAQVQSDWEETNTSSPAYILRKPDLSNYLTNADLAGYVTETDLNNYVTKTEDETIGGDKTFTDNVSVAATGSLEVPSVLNSIGTNGSLTVNGTGNCEQAVNFCDLETLYQSMLGKLNELNDQIDDLLDSIQKLNREQNAPQDGAPCPNTPTVTDNNGYYTYSTVRIGNQCWMRENLRGTTTSSSSYVSSGGSTPTYSTTDPLYVYPNLSSNNQAQYGLLYNYPAAQVICPPGWRLPSSADWAELRSYVQAKVGSSDSYAQSMAFTEGWSVSEDEGDVGYQNGVNNNAMGFSAKPAGIYPLDSYFAPYSSTNSGARNGFSKTANFWSSDKLPFGMCYWAPHAWIGGSSDIGSTTAANSVYMSVRCIRKNSNGEASTLKPLEVETNEPNSSNIYNRNVVSGSVSLTIKPGTITSNDSMPPATNISKYGFVYSHTVSGSNLKIGASNVNSNNSTTLSSSNQPTSYPFEMTSYDLTGLTSGYVYYYRAYAIRGADTVYGDVKQFTADSDPNSCKTKINSSYPERVTDQSDASISYPTVAIGSQCWLAENLRAYKYAGDGTSLVHLTDYFLPSGGSGNGAGYLYTFKAATGGTVLTTSTTGVQGICPVGWHVPTPDEFATLKTTMQGESSYQCGGTSSNIAAALASTSGWASSSTSCTPGYNPSSNNASGFNAYPAGYYNGSSIYNGYYVRFRTTTSNYVYYLDYGNSTLTSGTSGYPDDYGYTVRCIYGAAAPSVATGTASYSSISSTSAANPTFSYSVSSNILHNTGGSTSSWEKGVCYSTSSNPTLSNSKVTVSGSSTGTFSATLSGLNVGTTYYYRAYAKNAKGTSYGEVKSFTTATLASVATIHSKYNATNTSVNLKANVITTGGNTITSRVIQIRTAPYPNGSVVKTGTVSGNGSGYYEYEFTGLTAGTKYYAHAYVAQNINGTTVYRHAYNADFEFMLGTKPSVSMSSVTYNGGVCADLMYYNYTANLSNAGTPTITKKGFLVSYDNSTPTFANYTTGTYDCPVSGTSTGQFTYSNDFWGSNRANTTIYVRAYAINALDTVYSSVMTYRTRSVPDMWLATNFSDVYYYSSEVQNYTSGSTTKSKIRMSVGFTATTESSTTGANTGTCQQGLVYSTSPMSVTSSTQPSNLGGTVVTLSSSESTSGSGSYYIENLSPNTKYYIRAWGKNDAGYGYSAERVVRTPVVCGNSLHDQDGNTYSTVKMGSKCWMKQNIKATHYDNTLNQFETGSGTSITPQTGTAPPTSLTNRYSYYPNGNSSNVSGYGLLYNWAAATGQGVVLSYTSSSYSNNNMTSSTGSYNQGICPRGWHVPTSDEITSLITSLETTSNMSSFNWQQRAGWYSYSTANSSANYSEFDSYLELRGTTVNSSNANQSAGMYISSSPAATNYNNSLHKRNGTSVRCVQDIIY